jgi:hypothetical protein
MKTILKISTVLLLFLSASCMMNGVKGDGNVITQNRIISSDFTELKVSQGIEVSLTMSKETSLSLEADENLHDLIITEVEDGVLHIYSEENIYRSTARKVYLSTSTIDKINVSSGAAVVSENTIQAEDFEVNTSSGSSVRLMLNVSDLSCDTSSGSDARLKGTASHFVVNASSGSSIKAKELAVKTCDADVSSGASIKVNVSENLDANASSGGGIRYVGSPKDVDKNSSSGGSISGS